ncbi:MAG TPA: hypothetical protein VHW02_11825 [Rhizomicrobium sp.]|jgi:hypothetical protein|nr:hypothetical protein [Rhizomicrobium sp.]
MKKTPKPKTDGVTPAEFKKIALSFPGVVEKPSYGKPSIFIEKKFFTRLRKDDNSAVLYIGSIDEREMLLELDPKTFHLTEHYRDYPIVLARIEHIEPTHLRGMLERRWRVIVPKKLLKCEDISPATAAPKAAPRKTAKRKVSKRR